jgi:hypothetical protein
MPVAPVTITFKFVFDVAVIVVDLAADVYLDSKTNKRSFSFKRRMI